MQDEESDQEEEEDNLWQQHYYNNENRLGDVASRYCSMEATAVNQGGTTAVIPSRIPTRAEQIAKLKASASSKGGPPFDVLIVGGGATGAGAALDATTRGLSTALIERGDFGNETSARSTKLIWVSLKSSYHGRQVWRFRESC